MSIDPKTASDYRQLVATQGFDFAFRRYCRCELGFDANTIQGEQNRRGFQNLFNREIVMPSTLHTSHDSESILRGVPWA